MTSSVLHVVFDMDGFQGFVPFTAVDTLSHDLLLGMDFCRDFNCDAQLGKGFWRVYEKQWRQFASESDDAETAISAKYAGIETLNESQRIKLCDLVARMRKKPEGCPGVMTLVEQV